MFNFLQIVNYTEKNFNEDTYFVSNDFAFVIDGASAITNKDNSNYIVHSFVNNFKKNLSKELFNKEISIVKALELALENTLNSKLKDEYTFNDVSAAISIVRFIDDYCEVYTLGDCSVLLELDNTIKTFKSKDIELLDKKVIDKMKNISIKENISILESRKHDIVINHLKNNRLLKNKENGYWILDTTGIGIKNGFYTRIEKDEVKGFLICSDGFSQVYDTLNIYSDLNKLFLDLKIFSINKVLFTILEKQNNDKLLNEFPRFFKTDDITAVYIGGMNESLRI
ncbi:protein phosphatase 2C domain-containing protein [Miniphocaeibacter halophilus]|uniref:Protein phosphatase 2C domain-containing protein n=1 Tax=Miniphocaeibacter halophilus TaxID=2931922 RepID=A0AC61MQ61_9FIRM|nr:protein phosphatase 2C domain-containing protein [Miniphocaeibacter halophilus]QQK07720.1 protein phosphatase 2C domain-containing protein [Miniphocaeibacter halophilus]